tara:strand:- start:404 stop:610 length:207 start_codon:yes stop_codon:yes gene_type:complete
MRKIIKKNNLGSFLRRKKHIQYVESYVTQMRSRVCAQACLYGNIDESARDLYLKYNEYLKQLRNEYKN